MIRFSLKLVVLVFFAWISLPLYAEQFRVLPDEMIKPCDIPVQIRPITKKVVHMTPFRGVNLIFPFTIEENTVITLSSDRMWKYEKKAGINSISLFFKEFDAKWYGEVHDLIISHDDINFSIALVADPDITNHCTNIVFKMSEEMQREIEKKEKKEYMHAIDSAYKDKLKNLDNEVEKKALLLVGELSQISPSNTRIYADESITKPNGDEVIVYVDKIQIYKNFSVILMTIENESDNPLYIKGMKLNNGHQSIEGFHSFKPKLKTGKYDGFYVTRKTVLSTGASITVETDAGDIEVKW